MRNQVFAASMIAEGIRSRQKNPMFHSRHEAFAVIHEEVDELWDKIKRNEMSQSSIDEELVQIAAMCMCFSREVNE